VRKKRKKERKKKKKKKKKKKVRSWMMRLPWDLKERLQEQ